MIATPHIMTSTQILDRIGRVLFGDNYKGQMARTLMINRESTVDDWASGRSTPSPGVWLELAALLQDRTNEMPHLRQKALLFGDPVVTGRNVQQGLITLSRPATEIDREALQRSWLGFTRGHNLADGHVSIQGTHIALEVPASLADVMRPYREWFNAECDRFNLEGRTVTAGNLPSLEIVAYGSRFGAGTLLDVIGMTDLTVGATFLIRHSVDGGIHGRVIAIEFPLAMVELDGRGHWWLSRRVATHVDGPTRHAWQVQEPVTSHPEFQRLVIDQPKKR